MPEQKINAPEERGATQSRASGVQGLVLYKVGASGARG